MTKQVTITVTESALDLLGKTQTRIENLLNDHLFQLDNAKRIWIEKLDSCTGRKKRTHYRHLIKRRSSEITLAKMDLRRIKALGKIANESHARQLAEEKNDFKSLGERIY